MVNFLLLGLFVGGMTTGCITPLTIDKPIMVTKQESVDIEERAFTNLDISLDCIDKTTVRATIKNTFTIFPSLVPVDAYLYFTYYWPDSYEDMDLVDEVHVDDLNMGESLYLEYPAIKMTYYMCRCVYMESGYYKELITPLHYMNSNMVIGEIVQ